MARVHVLNVSPGDCTLIQHNSGRLTGIDICNGNLESRQQAAAVEIRAATLLDERYGGGNYGMCQRPSNPINYIKNFGLGRLFRFILSHPDMDHMDGLAKLHEKVGFTNFWDTGSRREKPSFEGFRRFKEEDWEIYEELINLRVKGVGVAQRLAGHNFAYANKAAEDGGGFDALHILAPNKELLCDPDVNDDINEGSYIIRYNSVAGPMVFPGDAHDAAWEFAIRDNPGLKDNCAFLLAPHHGRHSDRSYDFLDFLKPKLTVLGCAPSKYIDYGQWSRRGLQILTSNQAGNVVLEIEKGYYDVYIENEVYCRDKGGEPRRTNSQGYHFLRRIEHGS